MTAAAFSMRDLIEAGVHFGHKTKRWNPQMAPYIYGVRNDTHIIDLGQTAPMLHRALTAVKETIARNGRVLFVGTKRQAGDIIAETAKNCGQFYINQRWLGGLLTNWNTIQASIKRLKELEARLGEDTTGLTKKEVLVLERQRQKLEKSLGGIKDMGGRPDLLFIIDTNIEQLAVKEAQRLNIPIVAVVDTNAVIEGITYPVPGNDDATRAIRLYCDLVAAAVQDGLAARGTPPVQEKPEPVAKKAEEKPEAEEKPQAGKTQATTKKAAMKAAAEKAKAGTEAKKQHKKKPEDNISEEKPAEAAKEISSGNEPGEAA